MKSFKTAAMLMLIAGPISATSPVLAADDKEPVDDGRLAPGQTVADRAHPEYQAKGVRAGSFMVYPDVRLAETYDDNLFYQDTGTTDDFVTTLSPSVRVASDWSNHMLGFTAGADVVRHADVSSEDMDNYHFGADGRLDMTRDTHFTGRVEWRRDHEGRGSANAVAGVEPTGTDTGEVELGFEHRPGRVFVKGSLLYTDREFDNVQNGLGITINNADRDRTEDAYSLTLGYEIQPQYAAFVRYTRDNRDYDSAVDDNGFNRDSTGDKVELGIELDISGLLTGEITLGQMKRDYDDPTFADTDSWTTGTNVYWQASPLTTVVFSANRTDEETTTAASSGYTSTSYGVRVVHELMRNLVLDASLTATQHDYESTSRSDDLIDFSVGANYSLSDELYVGASYERNDRDSDTAGLDYDRNALMVYVGLRR